MNAYVAIARRCVVNLCQLLHDARPSSAPDAALYELSLAGFEAFFDSLDIEPSGEANGL